jgi:hypothetical protein
MVSKHSEIWSGLFIPDPGPNFLPIPDPCSRGQKGTGSRIRIRNTARNAVVSRQRCETLKFSYILVFPKIAIVCLKAKGACRSCTLGSEKFCYKEQAVKKSWKKCIWNTHKVCISDSQSLKKMQLIEVSFFSSLMEVPYLWAGHQRLDGADDVSDGEDPDVGGRLQIRHAEDPPHYQASGNDKKSDESII